MNTSPTTMADLTPEELAYFTALAAEQPQWQRLLSAYTGVHSSRAYGRDIISDQQMEAQGMQAIIHQIRKLVEDCDPQGEEEELRQTLASVLDLADADPALIGTEVLPDARLKWPDENVMQITGAEFQGVWDKMQGADGLTFFELSREEQLVYALGKVYRVAAQCRETIERRGRLVAALRADQQPAASAERTCRHCGCTELNCMQCIEKTGLPCSWVSEDECSACV